jgi:arsenate reductase-like glutaredoxin family protein
MQYRAPTGARIEEALLADPLLLKTPIVRCAGRASVGYVPEVWITWIEGPSRPVVP